MKMNILDKVGKIKVIFVQYHNCFWMFKKIKIILFLSIFLVNYPITAQAIPIGPIKNLLIEVFEKVPTFFDDLFKGGKKVDEVITNNTSKNFDELGIAIKDQEIIFKKVSKETHNFHLEETLNKSNNELGLKHGVKVAKTGAKKAVEYSDNLIDLFDFDFLIDDKEFLLSPYILKFWTGRVYQASKYFNKPKLDDKMLLVCKNDNEIFYFTILLNNKDDINRAYLTNYKFIKTYTKKFPRQELLVLHDEDKLKIMSTKPYTADVYPSDYFIIYENQFFKHSKYDDPKKIIENSKNIRLQKEFSDKCYKAKKNGIIY